MRWIPSKLAFGPSRPGPIVRLGPPRLRIEAISIGTAQVPLGLPIYLNANDTEILAGAKLTEMSDYPGLKSLQGWARSDQRVQEAAAGKGSTVATWERGRATQNPTCLIRNSKVVLDVRVRLMDAGFALGQLQVKAKLGGTVLGEGSSLFGKQAAGDFSVVIALDTALPNIVASQPLSLEWSAQPAPGTVFSFEPLTSEHLLFVIYGYPFDPELDFQQEHTLPLIIATDAQITATPKRLNRMMSLLGNRFDADKLEELYWQTHIGINDTPGAAPHFNAIHDVNITHNGKLLRRNFINDEGKRDVTGSGFPVPLGDQWLMWLEDAARWNAGSCIGHAQLMKTMLASIGLWGRRVYVQPVTTTLPFGGVHKPAASELVQFGKFVAEKRQSLMLTDKKHGKLHRAFVCLMEPGRSYENYEACFKTPSGKLLPGAYTTAGVAKDAPAFLQNKGFSSPLEVLQWWTSTKRGSFQRFLCWLAVDAKDKPVHCWDRDGKYYLIEEYEQIPAANKQLPLPDKVE